MNDNSKYDSCESLYYAKLFLNAGYTVFLLVMLKLLKETIPGAALDSSDRDPPPRCHPETRLSIINRTQCFITNCNGSRRMRWIVGPAGVGKSAIMQTLAEITTDATDDVVLGASIFFSINGRNDGTKAITTLAYQFAVNYFPYREFVEEAMTRDPSLLGKSMTAQFNKFIVEPFVRRLPRPCHGRFLIVIDGLDECNTHHSQCELLSLISDFCMKYPASPLVWVVASRPEPHITAFFSRTEVAPAYEKEEILVDSDEAREDVERFLHVEFKKIQMKSPALADLARWPTEHDFLKVADASDGLFAYASTVIKYIDDPAYGNPVSQLHEVLKVICSNSRNLVVGKAHPMAQLDALYWRMLSRVPADVMVDTRRILLTMVDCDTSFYVLGNFLGMTKDAAYGATYHLRAVLSVPQPDSESMIYAFHKSFTDFLKDFKRSKFSPDFEHETEQVYALCARRILEEAHNGTPIHLALDYPLEYLCR